MWGGGKSSQARDICRSDEWGGVAGAWVAGDAAGVVEVAGDGRGEQERARGVGREERGGLVPRGCLGGMSGEE